MTMIDPLTATAVLAATAATDAVYVMFTSAVVTRKRVPAAAAVPKKSRRPILSLICDPSSRRATKGSPQLILFRTGTQDRLLRSVDRTSPTVMDIAKTSGIFPCLIPGGRC